MDSPMFFGFVGLFNAIMLWPGLFIVHFVGSESFALPNSEQWQFLVINGLLGTVLSELLWLWGCFYTSSLVATLAISLNIPLTILADIVWKGRKYGPIFFVGAVPMFLSFFVVAMLTHFQDWDPVMDGLKLLSSKCSRCASLSGTRNVDAEERGETESESLMDSDQVTSHDEL